MDLFSYNSGNKHLRERALQGAAKHVAESGFTENWGESLRLDLDEASSISSILNSDLYTERNNTIMGMYESGEIPDEVMETFSRDGLDTYGIFDYDGLAQWANTNAGGELLLEDEIQGLIREDLKMKRDLSEEVFNRANWPGKFGQFAGAAHAAMIDPILIPTYFLGIGAGAKGVTWLSRFGRAAGVTAAVEGGLEAVRQPVIYNWKKDIGVDYKFKDALSQILAAGLGAGVLSGTASAVAGGLKKFANKNKIRASADSAKAVENIENTARELDRAPDPNIDAGEHLHSLEAEVKRQQTRDITPAEKPIYDAEAAEVEIKAEEEAEAALFKKAEEKSSVELGEQENKIRFVHGTSRAGVKEIIKKGVRKSDKFGEDFVAGFTNLERSTFGEIDVIVEVEKTGAGISKEAVEYSGEMVRVWRDIKPEEIVDIIDRKTGESILPEKLLPEDLDADIVLEAGDGTIVSKKYSEIVKEADEAATQQELALACLGNK